MGFLTMAKNPQSTTISDSEVLHNDQLNWNKKKQDLMLNLGLTNNSDSDQTPTPTRFIRNCEEVGLFQDLQNVNPFDESFKNAIGNPASVNSQVAVSSTDDTLHTPQIYPELHNTLQPSNNAFNSNINGNEPKVVEDAINKTTPSSITTVPLKRLLDPTKRQVKFGHMWQKEANKASQVRCRKRKQLEIENMREENVKLKEENANLVGANVLLRKRVAELETELTQKAGIQTLKKLDVKKVSVKQTPLLVPKHLAIAPKILPQPLTNTVIVLCQPSVPPGIVKFS